MIVRSMITLAVALAFVVAGCGGDGYDGASNGGAPAPTSSLATAVTTAGAGESAVLAGETFVSVRTLPPDALSADRLEDAGTATREGDGTTPMARAASPDVAAWEVVSPAADGWLVWRPKVVLDVLADAGPGARIVSVDAVDWPDACLGAAGPDEACAEVITPGYLVVLDRSGESIEYHASRAGRYRRVADAE